jgi:hypothetical protein
VLQLCPAKVHAARHLVLLQLPFLLPLLNAMLHVLQLARRCCSVCM